MGLGEGQQGGKQEPSSWDWSPETSGRNGSQRPQGEFSFSFTHSTCIYCYRLCVPHGEAGQGLPPSHPLCRKAEGQGHVPPGSLGPHPGLRQLVKPPQLLEDLLAAQFHPTLQSAPLISDKHTAVYSQVQHLARDLHVICKSLA